jgi:hypothetical protein
MYIYICICSLILDRKYIKGVYLGASGISAEEQSSSEHPSCYDAQRITFQAYVHLDFKGSNPVTDESINYILYEPRT